MSKYGLGDNLSPESDKKIEFLKNSLDQFKISFYNNKKEDQKKIKETTVSYFLDENIIKRPISLFYNEIKVEWKHSALKSNIEFFSLKT